MELTVDSRQESTDRARPRKCDASLVPFSAALRPLTRRTDGFSFSRVSDQEKGKRKGKKRDVLNFKTFARGSMPRVSAESAAGTSAPLGMEPDSDAKRKLSDSDGGDEMEIEIQLPQKRYYRQRAHSNPIADHCFD